MIICGAPRIGKTQIAKEKKFWYRIEDAVRASGLSKSEIARRGGFHRQDLTVRNGTHYLSIKTLAAFCRVTGVSADWILGLKEEL